MYSMNQVFWVILYIVFLQHLMSIVKSVWRDLFLFVWICNFDQFMLLGFCYRYVDIAYWPLFNVEYDRYQLKMMRENDSSLITNHALGIEDFSMEEISQSYDCHRAWYREARIKTLYDKRMSNKLNCTELKHLNSEHASQMEPVIFFSLSLSFILI
jgi:hypothetical protein